MAFKRSAVRSRLSPPESGALGILRYTTRLVARRVFFSVSPCDTLQGEPISACIRRTEIPPPWYPPGGQNLAQNHALGPKASHTLCAKFPCMCPIHPHMSAGWDFSAFCSFTYAATASKSSPRQNCSKSMVNSMCSL